MADHQQTMRRLALSDDQLVVSLLTQSDPDLGGGGDPRIRALVRLAALIASQATCTSYQSVVESALATGEIGGADRGWREITVKQGCGKR